MVRTNRVFGAAVASLIGLSILIPTSARAAVGHWSTNGPAGAVVDSIAFDPSAPSTMYVGTEGGIFRSTDGGARWAGASKGLGVDDVVEQIVVSPSSPDTLYAARLGHGGVYRSNDRSASWKPASKGLKGSIQSAQSVAVDPTTPEVAYAATIGATTPLFRTTDGGRTWVPANRGIETKYVSAIAVDPVMPNTVYAASNDGFFRSSDRGTTWTRIADEFDIRSFAISPSRPNTIYAGTYSSSVLKSIDGGSTWSTVFSPACRCQPRVYVDPTSPATAYAGGPMLYRTTDGGKRWKLLHGPVGDTSALGIDPAAPAHIYAGTAEQQVPPLGGSGDGLYVSTDSGTSWSPSGRGLKAPWEQTVASAPSRPATIYAGGASGVARSRDAGRTWRNADASLPPGIFVSTLAVSPADPNVVYAASRNEGLWRSPDGGDSWSERDQGLPRPWVTAMAIDPSAPTTLYAGGTSGGVFKSVDGGDTWVPSGLSGGVDAIAIDPSHAQTVYAYTGDVFVSEDGGSTWTPTGFPNNYGVPHLAVDGSGTVYAAGQQDHVFVSTNHGKRWQKRGAGLGGQELLCIAADPSVPGTVVVGTYRGVFRSTDQGLTWIGLPDGLRTRYVLGVTIAPASGWTIFAATAGGGVFGYSTG